ncbi:MAG: hypothetical protein IKM48_08940 [Clostridia bacterium]|nr:hypothetical protein [Clostridia bacterium]
MKRFLIFFLCFTLLLAPYADAAIGSRGLIIRDGKQTITLQKGEKIWLYVRDGFTKLPTLKELCYYSDNTIVASVGLHSGILRADNIGTATITVSNNKGDCGVLKVRVKGMQKRDPMFLLLLLPCLLLLLLKRK